MGQGWMLEQPGRTVITPLIGQPSWKWMERPRPSPPIGGLASFATPPEPERGLVEERQRFWQDARRVYSLVFDSMLAQTETGLRLWWLAMEVTTKAKHKMGKSMLSYKVRGVLEFH